MGRTSIEIVGDVPWGTHFCQFCRAGVLTMKTNAFLALLLSGLTLLISQLTALLEFENIFTLRK